MRRHVSGWILVFLVVLLSGGAFSRAAGDSLRADLMKQPGIVEAEFLYDKASFKSCHASTIAETKSYLVAAFFGGTGEGNKDVGIWVCRKKKDGGTWSAPLEAANGVQFEWVGKKDGKKQVKRWPCWNPVLFQPEQRGLMLFYKVGPDPETWWGMMCRSGSEGKRWSQRRRLPEGIAGPVRAKPVMLSDGTLLCGSSTENKGWRVHMEMTKNFGKTWTRTEALNDGKDFPAIQPTILVYPDKKIQILCRSKGNLLESWSSDRGKTWSPLVKSILPNPSAGIDAVSLKDGRQLLVYNHSSRGRSKLNVAVSKNGKEWKAALKLEDGKTIGGRSAYGAYPGAIQSADGMVHIVYTWKREKISYVEVDPSKLVLRDMPDGKWPD